MYRKQSFIVIAIIVHIAIRQICNVAVALAKAKLATAM